MNDFQATPEAFTQMLHQMIPLAGRMGIEATALSSGHAEATVPIEGNGNHLGTMYAGVLFTVAEVLGGALALSSFDVTKFYPVVKDMKITFRRPATEAVTAKASLTGEQVTELAAEAEANGKAQFILNAEVFDASGELVASTEGTYQLRAHGS